MPNQPIEVNLQGTFFEMGQQYIAQLDEKIAGQLALSRKYIRPVSENPEIQKGFDIKIGQLIEVAKKSYPREIMEFFMGALQTDFAKKNNLLLNDLVYLDNAFIAAIVAYKIDEETKDKSMDLCSFIGFDLEKGKVGGRNFDFPKNKLFCMNDTPVFLRMQHSNVEKYPNKTMSIGLPGTICNPTIFNDKNLFLEANTASDCTGKKTDFSRLSTVGDFLLHMMKAQSYQELYDFFITKSSFMGLNVSIAGPEASQLHTIEMSPYNVQSEESKDIPNFKNRARAANSENTLDPVDWDNNENMLVATNLFRLLDWPEYTNEQIPKESADGFSTERYENLITLGREVKDHLSKKPLDVIQKMMEHGINNNDPIHGVTKYMPTTDMKHDGPTSTYYTVAFKTYKPEANKTPKCTVRFQQQETPESEGVWTEWKKYRV